MPIPPEIRKRAREVPMPEPIPIRPSDASVIERSTVICCLRRRSMPEAIPIRPSDTQLLAHTLATSCPLKRCSRLTKPCDCILCHVLIRPGEMYRNGGLRKRAHDACAMRMSAAVQAAGS